MSDNKIDSNSFRISTRIRIIVVGAIIAALSACGGESQAELAVASESVTTTAEATSALSGVTAPPPGVGFTLAGIYRLRNQANGWCLAWNGAKGIYDTQACDGPSVANGIAVYSFADATYALCQVGSLTYTKLASGEERYTATCVSFEWYSRKPRCCDEPNISAPATWTLSKRFSSTHGFTKNTEPVGNNEPAYFYFENGLIYRYQSNKRPLTKLMDGRVLDSEITGGSNQLWSADLVQK